MKTGGCGNIPTTKHRLDSFKTLFKESRVNVSHITQAVCLAVVHHVTNLLTRPTEATYHKPSHRSCLCSLVCCHTRTPSGYMSHHHTCAHRACRVSCSGSLRDGQRVREGVEGSKKCKPRLHYGQYTTLLPYHSINSRTASICFAFIFLLDVK